MKKKKLTKQKSLENAHIFFIVWYCHVFLSFVQRSVFLEFTSLHRNRFHGKFRCFSHVKFGLRAKKRKRGGGEGKRKTPLPLPLFIFFALTPTFARLKHRHLPPKRLLRRLRVYWFLSFTEPFPLQWEIIFLAKTNYGKWGINFQIQLSAYSWII